MVPIPRLTLNFVLQLNMFGRKIKTSRPYTPQIFELLLPTKGVRCPQLHVARGPGTQPPRSGVRTSRYEVWHKIVVKVLMGSMAVWQCTYIRTYSHSFIRSFIRTLMPSYLHTFIHSSIHTFIHSNIHTFKHSYIQTFIHSNVHTFIRSYAHTFVRLHIHACMHACNHAFTYIHIHMYIYIYIYIYI